MSFVGLGALGLALPLRICELCMARPADQQGCTH